MLNKLSRILNEASLSANRDDALELILGWVVETLAVDVCVFHVRRRETGKLDPLTVKGRLEATIAWPGLTQLVVREGGPVRLKYPWAHPRNRPTSGDRIGPFRAYLGVPVIRFGEVLGVLEILRLAELPFEDKDSALLITLAVQLGGMFAQNISDQERFNGRQQLFQGTPAAPGIAIGTVVTPPSSSSLESVRDKPVQDVEAEISVFEDALQSARVELQAGSKEMSGWLPDEVRALYDVYEMILGDSYLVADAVGRIRTGQWAPAALRDTIRALAGRFEAMEDVYLRARAEDIRAVGRRILRHLQSDVNNSPELPVRTVLLGTGVGLTCITAVPPERLAGLACTGGSLLSHGVIVARALGIPAVAGVEGLRPDHCGGREIIVDGYRGRVILDPIPEVRAHFQRLQEQEDELDSKLLALKDLPSRTRDGHHLALEANIALLNEVPSAKDRGAEGVGLYRTEFPFLLRDSIPGEDTQYAIYRELLEAFAPRLVTMRALDAGGDKALPYLSLSETNPALGLRGIRLCLAHPEIFLTQLRALLRANAGLGNLRLMLPMVTLPSELEETQALIGRAHAGLIEEGRTSALPPVGIMLEVPAAVFRIDELAAAADFVSIGTNDLTQYVLAADRVNAGVQSMCDPLSPAVLEALGMATAGARRQGVPVSVCGEMAGDPLGSLLLLGLGVDALSMTPASIPRVKRIIREFSIGEAENLWEKALGCHSAQQVRAVLTEALERKGLGSPVRSGKSTNWSEWQD